MSNITQFLFVRAKPIENNGKSTRFDIVSYF